MPAAFDGPVSSCLPCVRPISTLLASSSTSASSFELRRVPQRGGIFRKVLRSILAYFGFRFHQQEEENSLA
ncbi:hypothetical protein TorRG33x02_204170 [Trema orientale]|uniref:Uncharacterized protein n=1 Tax=Trema orientale TaxID=63057 RepID=A0A2P5EDY7_TREOI|nr:hypothetical protein TorRG33x02_204170 [Trema orientale]